MHQACPDPLVAQASQASTVIAVHHLADARSHQIAVADSLDDETAAHLIVAACGWTLKPMLSHSEQGLGRQGQRVACCGATSYCLVQSLVGEVEKGCFPRRGFASHVSAPILPVGRASHCLTASNAQAVRGCQQAARSWQHVIELSRYTMPTILADGEPTGEAESYVQRIWPKRQSLAPSVPDKAG